MAWFTSSERRFAEAVSRIAYCNPFLPERITAEREALGNEFVEAGADWNRRPRSLGYHANVTRLTERAGSLAEACRRRLAEGSRPSEAELPLYEDVVLFALYHECFESLRPLIEGAGDGGPGRPRVQAYRPFAVRAAHLLQVPGVRLGRAEPTPHLFACFFQIRRAFHHIFTHLVGGSAAACRLRAAAWESIFTHDLRRYRRALYDRMGDVTTLITGPSGTGKELVARAIGLSRYIPFDDASQAFCEDSEGALHTLNLSALSPTLVESELFGHRRGSFTGAVEDRAGWLEVCRPLGAVFLDEVGEVAAPVQVKLLRVLQTRTFQRLGDTQTRRFLGKVIAATNRDLAAEMRAGRFREDFYYRLCSDLITTPSLFELLDGSAAELHDLVLFIAARIAPGEQEALAAEVEAWVARHLGPAYRWPGNFRELEQCVRNVLVRGAYRPTGPGGATEQGGSALAAALQAGALTADELLRRYCTLVYARTGSYEEVARRLGLDRRTVRSRVDHGMLGTLGAGALAAVGGASDPA